MAYYLFTGRYSADSIKAMVKKPQNREEVVRPFVEACGGKLHHLFFCFGADDVVALLEAPDDKTMAACSLAIGASGSMSSGATTKLMTAQEAMAAMKAAGSAAMSYKPPST